MGGCVVVVLAVCRLALVYTKKKVVPFFFVYASAQISIECSLTGDTIALDVQQKNLVCICDVSRRTRCNNGLARSIIAAKLGHRRTANAFS